MCGRKRGKGIGSIRGVKALWSYGVKPNALLALAISSPFHPF
jgi:hypothetical protein